MNHITLNANAKLNFSIDIVGVRNDGYHLMKMVMQAVNISDVVRLEKNSSNEIKIECEGLLLDSDKNNIAYKAAEAFYNATNIFERGLTIQIKKNIPIGAGMGGGSADGAAVLIGLNQLYKAKLAEEKLMQIGEKVGADIPFCIFGGTALVEGIGEKITKLADFPHCYFVIAKPAASVSTAAAFKAFDEGKIKTRPDTESLIAAIKWQDILTASENFCNVFEEVIALDEIDFIKKQMILYGGLSPIMTGSGSAVFSLFLEEEQALKCYYNLCEHSVKSYVCEPVKTPPQVIIEKTV